MIRSFVWDLAKLLVLSVFLSSIGCSSEYSAIFPETRGLAADPNAKTVGLARVEDNRINRVSGKLGGPGASFTVLAGADLDNYIERRFRNLLIEKGFNPHEVLDPATNDNTSAFKSIVITVQSVNVGYDSSAYVRHASVDIAVQVYPPRDRNAIVAKDYQGKHTGSPTVADSGTRGDVYGELIAAAADGAIQESLSDPDLTNALK